MGVRVREKPPGSGIYWIFINHQGKRKSKKIGKDETLAREIAEKIKAKLVLGELKIEKVEEPCPTFKEYAEMWLSLPHDWKEATRDQYKNNLNKHVYPVLKKHRINQIRRKDLKAFFDKLLINGLSSATISLVKAPISGVLSFAVDSELIENNPLSSLKISRKKRAFKIKPLTEKEADDVLEQAKLFMGGYYYPHILCALRTGMRIGEIKALKWKDIDFENRQVEVRRSCRRGRVTGTKTDKWRRVDITPHLAEALKELKTRQKRISLKNGLPVPEWVFAGKKGQILSRIAFENALNRCLEGSRLRRIRIHDLRHSYATIRLMRGHNVGDVSYQLGHSSIKMTYDVYAHWIPGQFKSEVDELDQMHPNAPYTHPANVT